VARYVGPGYDSWVRHCKYRTAQKRKRGVGGFMTELVRSVICKKYVW